MRRTLRLAWLALCLVTLASGSVGAKPRASGTILLVVDPRAEALATRVSAELEALGFTVQSQPEQPDDSMQKLASEARRSGAFAAIAIGPTAQGSVEITVLDRVTGKSVRREVLGRSLEDPTTRELVALRASELLRASLMEVEAPHPPRGEMPAPPAVSELARAPETIRAPARPLRLSAESGVLLVPGLSPTPLLQAAIGYRVQHRLELQLSVGTQLTAGQRSETQGRIEALARWASIGPRLLLLPRHEQGRVALGLDAAVTLVALSASGFASDDTHQGRSEFVWAPAATLGIDSKIRLYRQLWWALRPAVSFTSAELALRIDERDVRLWGRPWLQCSTGLEVEL